MVSKSSRATSLRTSAQAVFPRLRVIRLADAAQHLIEMPEPVYSVGGGANMEFDTDVFRFHYDSYITPDSEYDYHLDSRKGRC
jgi:oligopeptidase B